MDPYNKMLDTIVAISQVFSTCVACFSFLLAVVVVWYGRNQLKEMEKSRRLDSVAKLDDWIHYPIQPTDDRHFVLNELSTEPSKASDEDKKRARIVWSGLQKVAAYVQDGLIPPDMVMRRYATVFVLCWHKLKPYILEERLAIRGEDPKTPYYCKEFQDFAMKCYEYHTLHHPRHYLPDIRES